MPSFFDFLLPKKGGDSQFAHSSIHRLTYAIGDIHGRIDLFERILALIQADAATQGERPCVVLLGDYIDRGPDSAGVLERIIRLAADNWCDLHALVGNHEQSMLTFWEKPAFGKIWTMHGGAATLASYGIHIASSDSDAWTEIHRAFVDVVPKPHLDLLRNLELSFQAEDYLFVHAGVDPTRPLNVQGPETLLWIRMPFLKASKSCDYVVVHGHTPSEEVENKAWRIGVDTGAYASGRLTCVRLKGSTRHFFGASLSQKLA